MNNAPQQRENLGLWLGLLGVFIFGLTLPMTRLATGTVDAPQMSPWFVTWARAALAGGLSLAYLLAVRAPRPTAAQRGPLLLSLAGNVIGYPLLLGWALRHVTASHAAVITATPAAIASAADVKWRSLPATIRRPPSGLYWPPRIFSSVDLPAPFSPSRPCTVPAWASKLTPFSAFTPGKTLLTSSNSCPWSASRLPAAVLDQVKQAASLASIDCSFQVALVESALAPGVREQLAARDGALVAVIDTSAEEAIPLWRLVAERALCVNTTAAGGNASLMTLST
eukprot:gene27016-33676_t